MIASAKEDTVDKMVENRMTMALSRMAHMVDLKVNELALEV